MSTVVLHTVKKPACDLQLDDKIILEGYPDPLRVTGKSRVYNREGIHGARREFFFGADGFRIRLNNSLILYVTEDQELEVVV